MLQKASKAHQKIRKDEAIVAASARSFWNRAIYTNIDLHSFLDAHHVCDSRLAYGGSMIRIHGRKVVARLSPVRIDLILFGYIETPFVCPFPRSVILTEKRRFERTLSETMFASHLAAYFGKREDIIRIGRR